MSKTNIFDNIIPSIYDWIWYLDNDFIESLPSLFIHRCAISNIIMLNTKINGLNNKKK